MLELRSELCLLVKRGMGGKRALSRGNWVCKERLCVGGSKAESRTRKAGPNVWNPGVRGCMDQSARAHGACWCHVCLHPSSDFCEIIKDF